MNGLFLALGLVAGCGHATPETAAVTVAPQAANDTRGAESPVESDGPPYAGLFESGRTFHFVTETRSTWWDDQDPAADAEGNVVSGSTGTMTCHVDEVRQIGRALAAAVTCQGDGDEGFVRPTGFGGVYLATDEGLWHQDEMPADAAAVDALEPAAMLLAAVPVARDERHEDEEEEGFGWAERVVHEADGRWCVTRESWGGDESSTTYCFATGQGLVSGGSSFAGGVVTELTFRTAP